MKPKTLMTQIDSDGILRLEMPFAIEDAEQTVRVTVQSEPQPKRQWSPNFFTDVVGQWEGELVRPEQGELKEPDGWA